MTKKSINSLLYVSFILLLACLAAGKVLARETFKLSTPADILIADFEGEDYGDWQVTGNAFGPGPAEGTLPNQMQVTGYKGHRLVNSFHGGDRSTGTLLSPLFKIERPYINFLIGGGGYEGKTCINLLINGKIERTATGTNTQPGGSEQLDWHYWDVAEFACKTARIQIVDQHTGGWGHITIDHIFQSRNKREVVHNKTRDIVFSKKYLNLPVKNGAAARRIDVFAEGTKVREFMIELAPSTPDFWVYLDISEFQGQQGTIQIDQYSSWQSGFDDIFQADSFPGQENLYKEKLRPQFHFSSRRGWVNDTNGMVYHDGLYHMFYQHNPYGWKWGNMTWGHAVSTDLVHWQEWGDAIHPDELGTIFSGSAVVDHDNTSGFGKDGEAPLVASYTSAGGTNPWSQGKKFTQSLAYSNDGGRTWTKYANNPVIGHIVGENRDPKVIWHEETQQWVMVLFLVHNNMAFFTSPDLKDWTQQSQLKSFHECPELFKLPVDDDPLNKKWVLYGADGSYFIGHFDGTQFIPDGDAIGFQYGNCFYASQTFNNVPEQDGRRIQMAWGRIAMPDMPFNQMILFPVSLTLRTTDEGIRMFAEPVEEIELLHGDSWHYSDIVVADEFELEPRGELFHIKAQIDVQDAHRFCFDIRDIAITYDVEQQQLICRDRVAPLKPVDGKITFELLIDRMSIEIFANDGQVYMPMAVNLVDRAEDLRIRSQGEIKVINLEIYELNSIWQN